MTSKELIKRFNAKWRRNDLTGCYIWIASVAGKGYGQIKIPGTRRQIYAHRLAWEIAHGPIPKGMMICHRCDNPRCVNVEHMFLGTSADNLQDMASKDRHLYGERNTEAKITEQDVLLIYSLSDQGWSQHRIAKRVKIGQAHVGRILRGLRWRHIYERERRGK